MHRPSAQEFLLKVLETHGGSAAGFHPTFCGDPEGRRRGSIRGDPPALRGRSPVTEKIQRLVMHAFRGVPGEMTVDFGKGDSLAVYGDNGTGKSTIADALEWYFTGEIEFLRHEGRQHAVRHVGGDDIGVTSVEVITNGTLGGKVVFPDERNPEAFQAHPAGDVSPSRTHPGGLHQQDQDGEMEGAGRNPRPGRHRESSGGPSTDAKRASQGVQSRGRTGAVAPAGPRVGERARHPRNRARQSSADLSDVDASTRHCLSIRQSIPPGSPVAVGASVGGVEASDRESLLAEIKTLSTPAARHERPRRLECPRLVEAGAASPARVAGPGSETAPRGSSDRRALSAVRPEGE